MSEHKAPYHVKRTDSNHSQFTRALRDLGYQFKDTHAFPGMLDILSRSRRGHIAWFEIKSGPNEPLTEAEELTFAMFPFNTFKVCEVQQMIDILCELDCED